MFRPNPLAVVATALLASSAVFGVASSAAAVPGTPIADPDTGVKLATRTATLPATALQLDLTNSASWVANQYLADNDDCYLSQEIFEPVSGEVEPGSGEVEPGNDEAEAVDGSLAESSPVETSDASAIVTADAPDFGDTQYRVYSTLTVTILKPGDYTFRVVDSTISEDSDHPFVDPYLALYSTLSLSDLDAGVVGCNDDGSLEGDFFPGFEDSTYNGLWPLFSATLVPGTYTLMLTTYNSVTAQAWLDGNLGPQSVEFEYWGPECGVEGGICAADELAETGADTSGYLGIAAALMLAGLAMSVVARRRVAATRA